MLRHVASCIPIFRRVQQLISRRVLNNTYTQILTEKTGYAYNFNHENGMRGIKNAVGM
jgi:hypothetical protein